MILNLTQRIRDPDHAFGIPPSVIFKLESNPPTFLGRYISVCHPQKLIGGGAAFLNCQFAVTLTG